MYGPYCTPIQTHSLRMVSLESGPPRPFEYNRLLAYNKLVIVRSRFLLDSFRRVDEPKRVVVRHPVHPGIGSHRIQARKTCRPFARYAR